MYSKIPIF